MMDELRYNLLLEAEFDSMDTLRAALDLWTMTDYEVSEIPATLERWTLPTCDVVEVEDLYELYKVEPQPKALDILAEFFGEVA